MLHQFTWSDPLTIPFECQGILPGIISEIPAHGRVGECDAGFQDSQSVFYLFSIHWVSFVLSCYVRIGKNTQRRRMAWEGVVVRLLPVPISDYALHFVTASYVKAIFFIK